MGERFQFYIVYKTNDEEKVIGFHDQWLFGSRRLKYVNHLVRMLMYMDTEYSTINNDEYFKNYVKTILSLRWHLKPKKFYYSLVHYIEDPPNMADSNQGCVIIDFRDTKDIKASFFTIRGEIEKVETLRDENEDSEGLRLAIEEKYLVKGVFNRLDKDFYDYVCNKMSKHDKEHTCGASN